MTLTFRTAALGVGLFVFSMSPVQADNAGGEREVLQVAVLADQGALPADAPQAGAGPHSGSSGRESGGIEKQIPSVVTGCFPASLRAVLADISSHFGGKPVIVTSGHRHGGRRGSYHRKCMAADIQIAGISPGAIARYARSHPSVGGVGTYGHTRSVHVDVGGRVYSWYGKGRGRRYAQTQQVGRSS
ncbi:MAG: YcbK family protein [Beijerinckiaceae bacterium]